jgi:hypothetical protein
MRIPVMMMTAEQDPKLSSDSLLLVPLCFYQNHSPRPSCKNVMLIGKASS